MEILNKTPRKSCFTGPIISSSHGASEITITSASP